MLRDLAAASAASRAGLRCARPGPIAGSSRCCCSPSSRFGSHLGLTGCSGAADNGALADSVEGYGFATIAKLISDNAIWVGRAIAALIVVAGLAAFYNLWRAPGFTALLYRGLQMLRIDMVERRRDLDASIERADRKLANVTTEAEVAASEPKRSPAAPAAPAAFARPRTGVSQSAGDAGQNLA